MGIRIDVFFTLGALAALPLAAACQEHLSQPPVVQLLHYEAGTGAFTGEHVIPSPSCDGRCCPAASECFPAGNPSAYSGAECLARRDNSGPQRWQFRQTFSLSLRPPGISDAQIGGVLVHRSELPSPNCGAKGGTSGFIQLLDVAPSRATSRVGFAGFSPSEDDALANGLCMVDDTYDDREWALPALYAPPAGWPEGLPAPMPLPWHVEVVTALRVEKDFVVADEREALLARFAPGSGDLAGRYNGIFYLDETKGYLHGFAPLAYILNYDSATQYNAIPIRETETVTQLNDPGHPNCAGSFLGDNAALPANCTGDATNHAWGCPAGNCPPTEPTPNRVEGYFLQAELEQIHNSLLQQTLCVRFSGGDYAGWSLSGSCRSGAQFNPMDPVRGLPPGDWCAAKNRAADGECHDAWKSVSYPTFQAFPVREGTCPAR